jgi:phosphate uptake regulator
MDPSIGGAVLIADQLPVDIPHMASVASGMVRKALQSFIEGDAENLA